MKVIGVDLGVRKAALAHFSMQKYHNELTKAVSLHVHPRAVGSAVSTISRAAELNLIQELVTEACSGADYVFIEEPLVGRGGVKVSLQISQTAGAIMAGLGSTGVHCEMVNVSHWKKSVIGSGNAGKKDVALHLEQQFPVYSAECGNDQDKRDAVCVGLYGIDVLRRVKGWFGGGEVQHSDGGDFPFLGES